MNMQAHAPDLAHRLASIDGELPGGSPAAVARLPESHSLRSSGDMAPARAGICAVAIARDEGKFIEEWLAYHRLIGVNAFVLYDDDPALPLAAQLRRYSDVIVVPWHGVSDALPGRNRQTKAYWHFHCNFSERFEWITFIDIDEFIVLRDRATLPEFLADFPSTAAISLQWHVFGHNGYFEDPPGLVTACLTKRMSAPSRQFKSITRPETIAAIESAHGCRLKKGFIPVDANGKPFGAVYEGITRRAHINHYQCRSFDRWMSRVVRGDVNEGEAKEGDARNRWRIDSQSCLRQFVETVARDKNECSDEFLRSFVPRIEAKLRETGADGSEGDAGSEMDVQAEARADDLREAVALV